MKNISLLLLIPLFFASCTNEEDLKGQYCSLKSASKSYFGNVLTVHDSKGDKVMMSMRTITDQDKSLEADNKVRKNEMAKITFNSLITQQNYKKENCKSIQHKISAQIASDKLKAEKTQEEERKKRIEIEMKLAEEKRKGMEKIKREKEIEQKRLAKILKEEEINKDKKKNRKSWFVKNKKYKLKLFDSFSNIDTDGTPFQYEIAICYRVIFENLMSKDPIGALEFKESVNASCTCSIEYVSNKYEYNYYIKNRTSPKLAKAVGPAFRKCFEKYAKIQKDEK